MAQNKSAIKRDRQNQKRNAHNRARRSKMRTLTKNVFESSNKEEAMKAYKESVAYLDRMSTKGVIHANNAARKKSQLTRHINAL